MTREHGDPISIMITPIMNTSQPATDNTVTQRYLFLTEQHQKLLSWENIIEYVSEGLVTLVKWLNL